MYTVCIYMYICVNIYHYHSCYCVCISVWDWEFWCLSVHKIKLLTKYFHIQIYVLYCAILTITALNHGVLTPTTKKV